MTTVYTLNMSAKKFDAEVAACITRTICDVMKRKSIAGWPVRGVMIREQDAESIMREVFYIVSGLYPKKMKGVSLKVRHLRAEDYGYKIA